MAALVFRNRDKIDSQTLLDTEDFDYYVFAQSISVEACLQTVNSDKALTLLSAADCYTVPKNANIIGAHGLWPSLFTDSQKPAYCSDDPLAFDQLSTGSREMLREYYTPFSLRLLEHEWAKHGTCSGTSQQKYFDGVISYYEKLSEPAKTIIVALGKTLSYKEIIDAYQDAGTGTVELQCRESKADQTQYLTQVATLWGKDNKPITLERPEVKQCAENQPIQIGQWPTYQEFDHYRQAYNKKYLQTTAVGFDIDDTVLFSSPGFYHLRTFENLKPGNPQFWQEINNGEDEYNPPKQIAQQLLTMHEKKGDKIYFITKRAKTETETLSKILQEVFNLQSLIEPVVFTDLKDKTSFIEERGIQVYYGDADADMLEAKAAGAEPVRVMRGHASSAQTPNMNGAFGETVILDSDR